MHLQSDHGIVHELRDIVKTQKAQILSLNQQIATYKVQLDRFQQTQSIKSDESQNDELKLNETNLSIRSTLSNQSKATSLFKFDDDAKEQMMSHQIGSNLSNHDLLSKFSALKLEYDRISQQFSSHKLNEKVPEINGLNPMTPQNEDDLFNVEQINLVMTTFLEMYSDDSLQRIRDENPMDFMDSESTINRILRSYDDQIVRVMDCCKVFRDCIQEKRVIIKQLTTPQESEYESWNIEDILLWIGHLENGRFTKYWECLKRGFMDSEITTGSHLPDLDVAVLSVPPFNISSFPDKRDLVRYFKALSQYEIAVEDGTISTHIM